MGCKKCGTCCRWNGYVYITKDDIKNISLYLNLNETDFIDKYTVLTSNRQGLSLTEKDGNCVFLNKNSCEIYSVRPKQCVDFPKSWKLTDMNGCNFFD